MTDETAEIVPSCGRKWWVAALLTFLTTGLGQVYNGQIKKGILFFSLLLLTLVALWVVMGIVITPFNIAVPVLVLLSVYIYILRDAIITARRIGESYQPKAYNKWYVYLIVIVIASFIVSPAVKGFLIEA